MEKIKKYFEGKGFKEDMINKIFCLWEQRFPQGTPNSFGTIGERVLFLSLAKLNKDGWEIVSLYLDVYNEETTWKD